MRRAREGHVRTVALGVLAALCLAGCTDRLAAEEERARLAAERAAADEEAKVRAARATEHAEKLRALRAQLAGASSDVERARLRGLIAEEKARADEARRSGGRAPSKPGCVPGDPLCTGP